eukprot:471375_1
MAFDLWKRHHRFGISLTLLVYSICYLICDYFYINEASLETRISMSNLYRISLLLISISALLLIIFDTIANRMNQCLSVLISTLMIIGGLLYFTLTGIQSLQRHQNNEQNALLFTLLYTSCAFFIGANTLTLAIINLLNSYYCKTILLINSIIFIITSTGMIYFWAIYYKYSSISPTQMQIGLIQTGWVMIVTVASGTVIYETMNSKHIPFLRVLSVLLVIGGFLIFSGSSAFSVDIIFCNNDIKHDFVIKDNIEIVIEWSLSFAMFICCITFGALIMRSTKDIHFTHMKSGGKSTQLSIQNKMNQYRYPSEGFNMNGFDIMLETEPTQPRWADV